MKTITKIVATGYIVAAITTGAGFYLHTQEQQKNAEYYHKIKTELATNKWELTEEFDIIDEKD